MIGFKVLFRLAFVILAYLCFVAESKVLVGPVSYDEGYAPGGYQFGDGYGYEPSAIGQPINTPAELQPAMTPTFISRQSLSNLQIQKRKALKAFLKMLEERL
ncbi:uncharacterized protein ACR2FA_004310 [Aphomia sociella]